MIFFIKHQIQQNNNNEEERIVFYLQFTMIISTSQFSAKALGVNNAKTQPKDADSDCSML
jgi:hypothetical protein